MPKNEKIHSRPGKAKFCPLSAGWADMPPRACFCHQTRLPFGKMRFSLVSVSCIARHGIC